jgi:hypothetical protein
MEDAMAEFKVAGRTVWVSLYKTPWPVSLFRVFQGITVKVDPKRKWYCLWLCSTSSEVDRIQASIELQGPVVQPAQAQGECNDCGSLRVTGPQWTGNAVPYAQVTYGGQIVDGDSVGPFSGSDAWT